MTGSGTHAQRRGGSSDQTEARLAFRYPPPRPRAITRRHLFDRLDAGVLRQLTLVTGPAGAGKTTLLSTWLAQRSWTHPVAWLALEPADGRPARFWGELTRLVREAAGPAADLLPDPEDAVDDEFIAAVAAAAEALPEPVLIVLDSFERLRSPAVIGSLDLLLHIPQSGLRFVIAGRRDPNLSLQRLRLAGELSELRGQDLAFSEAEAQELCELANLPLDGEQVAKLHQRTEGWVAGLSLAALSLSEHADPDEFVERFAGDDRTVADYLVEEVLRQQPPPIRDFMLRTSVVDTLEPELADALTGRSGGAAALSLLERSNAFLIPLDEQRRRFRYHPMFQELLQSQLRYRMPDLYALEHRRASRWFADQGSATAAIRHAIAAGDDQRATGLVCEYWLSIVLAGDAERLREWIEGLAPRILSARSELALAAAGAELALGELQGGERYLELADAGSAAVPAKRRARYVLSRAAVRMFLARAHGDLEALRTAAQQVLAAQDLRALPGMRAVALLHLGVADHWAGEPELATSRLEEALELARRDRCELAVLDCLGELALAKALSGSLRDAADQGRAAVRLAVRNGWEERGAAAGAQLALGIAHLYWGELERAAVQLERAELAARNSQTRTTVSLIAMYTAMTLAWSDVAEALRLARAARRDVERWQLPGLAGATELCEAALLADAGDADGAGALLERGPAVAAAPSEAAAVRARLALAAGEPAEALRVLRPHLGEQCPAQPAAGTIEALALGAVAKHLLHDDEEALALLERALGAAQPEHCRLPILRVGLPLRDLLRRRIRAGTCHRSLAGELLEMLDQPGEVAPDSPSILLDPLSVREEAVLRYLPTVMSKAEIASELFVSVNTVKTHTQNIYRKLGVSTRTGAVRRARQLNLM